MKKSIILTLMLLLVIAGCAKETVNNSMDNKEITSYYNYRDAYNVDEIDTITAMVDTIIDITDVDALAKFVDNVFIGTVESIDGCSTIVATGEYNGNVYEYGNVRIIKNLKGEIKDDVVTFAKRGGIISIADLEKYMDEEEKKDMDIKRKSHGVKIDKENTYENYYDMGDIRLEPGKTYIFFTKQNKKTGVYIADGFQYGTREIVSSNEESIAAIDSFDGLKIKNNDTGKYEDYATFEKTYFTN